MSRVAIQVLLYHSSSRLEALLESLRAQTFTDWELFFLDNSCDADETERVREALSRFSVPVYLTLARRNEGFAGGHNFLYAHHRSPFVLLLNDDALLEPAYLERCVRFLEANPSTASVTGLLYRWIPGSLKPDLQSPEAIIDTAGLVYRCLALVADRATGLPHKTLGEDIQKPQRIFGASGVAALFRRETLDEVSLDGAPFDPDFFMYKEDVDLAIRLARRGHQAWLEPHAVGFHVRTIKAGGRGWLSRMRDERRRGIRVRMQTYHNQWALYVYHASWRLGYADLLFTFWYEFKRSAALFFLASPMVFFRAWGKIFRHLPRLLLRRRVLMDRGVPLARLRIL